MTRESLSDILREGDRQGLARAWGETQAAGDFRPLPPGGYVCHVIAADLFNAKTTGTPGATIAFTVIEGEHAGRQVWHDVWLAEAALPMAKRDLAKLGVMAFEQLERPLPPGIRCRVDVALRKDDDGAEHNRVKRFAVVGIDEPEQDAFAPVDPPSSPAPLPQAGEGRDVAADAPSPSARLPRAGEGSLPADADQADPPSPQNPRPQTGEGSATPMPLAADESAGVCRDRF